MTAARPTHTRKENLMNPLPEPTTADLSPLQPMERRTGCLTPDCTGKHQARGLCRRCYRKAYYRANAARSLELNRRWRAAHSTAPTVSGHPVDGTDVVGVDEAHGVRSEGGMVPAAPARTRATPVAKDGATTGRGRR